jgi:hypothetical protein
MYSRVTYFDAARRLRAMWVCAKLTAKHTPYNEFVQFDAEIFSVQFVELEYICAWEVYVAPITRAIVRAAKVANCTEFEVIAALAATPKFVAYRICDYLDALANWDMHNISPTADMFSGLYGHNKFVLQCLVMALLDN